MAKENTMAHTKNLRSSKRQTLILGAGLLSASAALGCIGPVSAQQDNQRWAQRGDRWNRDDDGEYSRDRGRRNDSERSERYRDRDFGRNDRDDRYDDRGNNSNRDNLSTMEGTVSNDIRSRTFGMLLDSGGQIAVQPQGGVPNRLSPGDRVRIYGNASNGVFYARNVAFLSDRDNYRSSDRGRFRRSDDWGNRDRDDDRYDKRSNGDRYDERSNGRFGRDSGRYNPSRGNLSTMEGTVSNDTINSRTFRMLLNSGGQITVQVRGGVPGQLSPGDRVRIYGSSSNGVFYAQNVAVLRNR